MPVIHTHVSVKTTPEQREALKAAYGKAITAVPGKSEGWLMCHSRMICRSTSAAATMPRPHTSRSMCSAVPCPVLRGRS